MSTNSIVYIGGFELPDKNAAAHRVVANGNIFRDLGYDVVFIGVDKDRKNTGELARHDENFFGFECWNVPYPKSFLSWLRYIVGLNSILTFLKSRCSQQEVKVVCYNYPAIAQFRIGLLCGKYGATMLSDVTEWYDASGGTFIFRIVKWIDTSLRMYIVNLLADGLITTSSYLTTRYSNSKKQTVELPTLFDTKCFNHPVVDGDRKYKKFIYVGVPFNVGKVQKDRGNLKERLDMSVDIFYKLFSEGIRFEFDIYGITKEDYLRVFPEHQGKIEAMEDYVNFHGRLPNSLVLRKISESDFTVFFRDETRTTLSGFPSKLSESISCGTPVLTNRMPNIEKYADSEFLFLLDKSNTKANAISVLKRLTSMPQSEVNRLKEAAFNSGLFDYRSYLQRVELFFDRVK